MNNAAPSPFATGATVKSLAKKPLSAALAALLLVAPAQAQGLSDTPAEMAAFTFGLCALQGTAEIPNQLTIMMNEAEAAGLPQTYADDKSAKFGSPDGVAVSLSKTIDSLTCEVKFAPGLGTAEVYAAVEAPFAAWVASQSYEQVIPSDRSDPSPHIDGYNWVIFTTGKDIIVYQLTFGTEDGVKVFANVRKNYD